MTSPRGVAGPVLAYRVPALPPAELMPQTSVIASMTVDFPEPFSATRNATEAVRFKPCSER